MAARIAIITGASHSIGPSTAQRLARDGFSVVINYSNDAAPAEKRDREIGAAGGRALPFEADLFRKGQIERSHRSIRSAYSARAVGAARDIANAAAFLVGPDGGWINGQILRANDGII